MENLTIEKIQRSLFQQGMKKEQEEKNKYPASKGQITDQNINDFFEFNDISDGGAKSPKSLSTSFFSDKEIKFDSCYDDNQKLNINYNINSFLDNEEIPDLYTPLGKISGNNYQINDEYDSDLIENNSNSKYKTISKKRIRYFDLDFDIDFDSSEIELTFLPVPKKKSKKNKFRPHNVSRYNSPKIQKFCYICLSTKHSDKNECPKYKRCIKCLKYGHWAKNCEEIIKDKCENCNISAHNKEDCLKFNDGIKYDELLLKKNKGIDCAFCRNKYHLICPFSTREKYILNYGRENKDQDFSNTLFCPFCAGNHLKINCPENINYKNISKSNSSKYISENSNLSFNEKSFEMLESFDNNSNDNIEINEDYNSNYNKNNNLSGSIINKKIEEKNDINKNNIDIQKDAGKTNNIFLDEENDNINKSSNYNYLKSDKFQGKNNNKRKKGNLYYHYKKYKERMSST